MKSIFAEIRGLLIGDTRAAMVVPPTGFTAYLTIFSTATMAFLGIFAVVMALSAGRVADRWAQELAKSATVLVTASQDQMQDAVAATVRVLETTAGVGSIRVLSDDEQRDLLVPWFGPDMPVDVLPLPQLIEVIPTSDGFDPEGLRLRLQGEAPDAILDDHGRWQKPLIRAAQRLRLFSLFCLSLIAITIIAVVTLAAKAALSANAKTIHVLRLVGATDEFVAKAFVRRFTLRAIVGAAVGVIMGIIAIMLLSNAGKAAGFLTDFGLMGINWLWPLILPLLFGLLAFFATRAAALRLLRELT
ncbi:cell division protein FtsX [Parasulfitobacter algicola]|uniref:FtsX-like permease family protein n=1 Tax=Parasulfitobacter algicola TaxID=2614809 RepID=A0ABX2ILU6_9RHOB|nr:FtsX-like permease family protein [Sulfitobacter algicola]NSX53852.1 FtsX-like permease family protein [Sulfitobacter algicola]